MMVRKLVQRLLALSIGALAMTASSAMAADDVSVRLNWYQVGFHVPLYLGKEKGFFADEGINLTINEGRGSGVAAQVVGAGDDTFGICDSGTLIISAVKGIPVKTVASPMAVSPFGIIFRTDSGIKTVKDLEGKTLAVTAGDALTQLFPAVVAANNLDADKINTVFVDPAGKVVAVLEKKADALLGSADAQVSQIEAKGVDASAIDFADIGVDSVGLTVIAHEDTIKSKPDMIKRFIKALGKSFEATIADPDEAVAAAVRAKPDANGESLMAQLLVDLELLETPATKGKGFGYNAPEDWERTLQLMVDYRELKTDRPASSFYTNDFISN